VNDVTYSKNYITVRESKGFTFVPVIFQLHLSRRKRGTFIKISNMGYLLYVIAVILIIAWAIGFFAYSAGGIIHILLVIAIIAIIFRVIQGRKVL
jgi:hypothetical protein